jgi:hypothetical protein
VLLGVPGVAAEVIQMMLPAVFGPVEPVLLEKVITADPDLVIQRVAVAVKVRLAEQQMVGLGLILQLREPR